ncbi:MAG TPA: RNA 2',3'-cyclic phosphodiesterase, partial [Aquificaceae bacterium]|nr:RNA 2',3'-cyclic phosphodiesterase [Aquificaceae bacterium]
MRAFVGYFTTRSIHEHVDRFREEAEDFVKGKWVEPQNFHMTFQFLGEINRERAIGVLK